MGIPFYFRYLMKNHPKMLSKAIPKNVDHLYLDSNSIIYDCVHALLADKTQAWTKSVFETKLRESVIQKIQGYISYCHPQNVFIAFDGVAPLSKMDQQRSRRHKHLFTGTATTAATTEFKWNTNVITPGTQFMHDLANDLKKAFANEGGTSVSGTSGIILSTAEEPGEGEHKLFAHLRSLESLQGDVVVYGLDADLIMLSLLHLRYVQPAPFQLWVFREAPHFDSGTKGGTKCGTKGGGGGTKGGGGGTKASDKEECLHLDVGMLARCILQEMHLPSSWVDTRRLDDYVFMCFLLGNDFLPHFPCLNLRTNGMHSLMDMYRMKGSGYLVDAATGTIDEHTLFKWLGLCAQHESEWLLQEKETRNKMAASLWKHGVHTDDVIDQVPLLFRGEELYIDAPTTLGWQQRYYRALFDEGVEVSKVCAEYLRGLQWVWQYYTRGCSSWRWRYPFTYAPLLQDLIRFRGAATTTTIQDSSEPLPAQVQLAYVLPQLNHAECIRDADFVKMLQEKYGHLYVDKLRHFHWSFCRYFWEAHPILPDISVDVLQEWVDTCT
jgi:5'-3' exonuclease